MTTASHEEESKIASSNSKSDNLNQSATQQDPNSVSAGITQSMKASNNHKSFVVSI